MRIPVGALILFLVLVGLAGKKGQKFFEIAKNRQCMVI